MAPVRWAILGAGTAGFARSKAIRRDPRSELVAVFRGRRAAEMGAAIVGTVEEALALCDAVAVCSPNHVHPEQVAAGLTAGRHVVVEYPLAPDEAGARALFDLARKAGRVLHVEHIELLSGVAQILKGNVQALTIEQVTVTFQGGGSGDRPGADLALTNVARLHRLVHVAGNVRSVDAVAHAPGKLTGTLTLANGAHVALSFEESPYFSRLGTMELRDHRATWRQENQALFKNGHAQTLLEAVPLFEQDHATAMRKIAGIAPGDDGLASYLSEETILHVMRVVDRLRLGRPGPVI